MKRICRVLFSRYAISALFFIAELLLLALLLSYASGYSYVFPIISTFINAAVVISLLDRDVNPEFKVSWLVAISFIPFFGAILYVIFYSRKLSRRDVVNIKKMKERYSLGDKKRNLRTNRALSSLAELDVSAAGRACALLNDDFTASLYRGADLKYFSDGGEMYAAMLNDLAQAEKYIFLEYFIIAEGRMWDGIYEILIKKSKEGVDVRVLYDDIGCMKTLPASFASKLAYHGIACTVFGRVSPMLIANHNNRDHRKITVIDGKVAYTGGINISDEYINAKERFGHWKDGGVRVFGDCAEGFANIFLTNWHMSSGKIGEVDFFCAEDEERIECGSDGYFIPFCDGPIPLSPKYTAKNAFMNIINRAEKYLYVTTPYLIIDYDLTEALKASAHRGVDVRIITPGIADKRLVKLMTRSSYLQLVCAGVRIFEYTPGFIHEKIMISDDVSAIVGTVNFDYRSLVHHFENALWIFASAEIVVMRESFLDTCSLCREISEAEARLTLHEKMLRALIRLFSPLL